MFLIYQRYSIAVKQPQAWNGVLPLSLFLVSLPGPFKPLYIGSFDASASKYKVTLFVVTSANLCGRKVILASLSASPSRHRQGPRNWSE
jgi:hypothetical protein